MKTPKKFQENEEGTGDSVPALMAFDRPGVVRPVSKANRVLLETPVLRKLGRQVVRVYKARIDNEAVFNVRTRSGDLSTLRQLYRERPFGRFLRVQAGQTVIDAGAHIGGFAVRSALTVGKDGRVIAFEPSSENFHFLQENIGANSLTNVTTFNAALGSNRTTGLLFVYKKSASHSFIRRSNVPLSHTETVPILTLDSVVEELGLRSVDCIKVNVEGHELEVLKGAVGTLAKFRPRLAIDTHRFGPPVEDIIGMLEGVGYTCELRGAYLYGSSA